MEKKILFLFLVLAIIGQNFCFGQYRRQDHSLFAAFNTSVMNDNTLGLGIMQLELGHSYNVTPYAYNFGTHLHLESAVGTQFEYYPKDHYRPGYQGWISSVRTGICFRNYLSKSTKRHFDVVIQGEANWFHHQRSLSDEIPAGMQIADTGNTFRPGLRIFGRYTHYNRLGCHLGMSIMPQNPRFEPVGGGYWPGDQYHFRNTIFVGMNLKLSRT